MGCGRSTGKHYRREGKIILFIKATSFRSIPKTYFNILPNPLGKLEHELQNMRDEISDLELEYGK